MDLKQAFFPAETQRAPEVIYDQIYQQIASGQLKPGDRLPSERVLAEQFQRSRHVIREALRMLQQDGLITVEVGSAGGSIVQQVSADLLGTPLKHYLADGGLSLLVSALYPVTADGNHAPGLPVLVRPLSALQGEEYRDYVANAEIVKLGALVARHF